MQTFAPFRDFKRCARILDSSRLQKQRIEAIQLIQRISPEHPAPARNHPAEIMWKHNLPSLVYYTLQMHDECNLRGIADHSDARHIIHQAVPSILPSPLPPTPISLAYTALPWWWGSNIHRTHRQSLILKLPEHYTPHFPHEPPLPKRPHEYVWPMHHYEYHIHDDLVSIVCNRYKKPFTFKLTRRPWLSPHGLYAPTRLKNKTPAVLLLQPAPLPTSQRSKP